MSLEDGIPYIKVHRNLTVKHGVDGWYLDDMTWYGDGVAEFQYERIIPGVGIELAIVTRNQPTLPDHPGWNLKAPQGVLKLSDKDWLRIERGIDLYPDQVVGYE